MMRTGLLSLVLAFAGAATARAQDRSGVRPEVMSLPSGPGSIEGLGESFDASPQSGAASYRVPIRVPPAVAGFVPSLALSYSSGGGNSELGLGWSLGQPTVQRSTDRQLPGYDDSDRFVLRGMGGAGAEDLVQLLDGSYRFRIEGAFARGEQRSDGTWAFRNKSGVTFIFGEGNAATVRDGSRVFSWCLTRRQDTHGNEIAYEYDRDAADRPYLTRIVYNDFSPEVRNEVVLIYEARPDVLTSYVSTFAVTTARRLERIEVRHGGETILTYTLGYEMAMDLSRLASVHLVGRDGVTDLPTLRLSYAELNTDAATVVTMTDAPARALGQVAEIDDVNGDALPDLLVMDPSLDGGRYSWYPNLDGESFGPRQVMTASPSVWLDSAGVQLADMDGDGAADVVARLSSASDGFRYYPAGSAGDGGEFGTSVLVSPNPSFAFDDPDVKLVDLNHDRLSDWLRIDPSTGAMSAGFNRGDGMFSSAVALGRLDPAQVLSFSGDGLSLADMNGDGLTDLVAVRSVSVRYWPAMGGGRFDDAIDLPGAPVLSGTELSELQVRDLNGDGLSDLVHVGVNQVRWWRNVSGTVLAPETAILGTPERRPTTVVRVADMNGNGSGDIVWMDPADSAAPWRYLDVLAGGSPGLLTGVDNGLGKVVTISYEGMGAMRGWARAEGIGWTRRCPVGQHVVAHVAIDDSLGNVIATQYRYADAYYDGSMREVRGFARAFTYALGDAEQPTLVTDATFDVGDTDEARKGLGLSVTRRTEAGGVFDIVTTTYDVRTVAPAMRYAVAVRRDTALHELGPTARTLRSEWDYDDYGNVIREANYGEVLGTDVTVGDDEVINERSYVINEDAWIIDRLATQTVRSIDGERVAETRTYYDGPAHQGLPLGEVGARGDVTRVTSWIEGNRFALDASHERDPYGNPTTTLDGRGGQVDITYDADSHTFATAVVQWVDDTRTLEWTASYDRAFGLLTEMFDPNGHAHRAGYDGLGRVIALVQPGDTDALPTTSYEYVLGSPASYVRTEQREQTDESGVITEYSYVDGLGRARGGYEEAPETRWAAGGLVRYGPRGLVRFAQHPTFSGSADLGTAHEAAGGVWTEYDALGRAVVQREVDGAERRTVYAPLETASYDENDTDPSSPHYDTPTISISDGLGRARSIVERDGARDVVTSFYYDALSNLTKATDAESHVRTYRYDGRSRLVRTDEPNAGVWTYAYDGANALVRRTDGGASVVRFELDRLGRTRAEYHQLIGGNEQLSVGYDYDERADDCPGEFGNLSGQLARVQDEAGAVCVGYDDRGRATDRLRRWSDDAGGGDHFSWTDYDAADRVVRRGYPDGSVLPIEYDERGLLVRAGGIITGATWTAWAGLDAMRFGNGVTDRRSYDGRLRATRMAAGAADGTALRDLTFAFDGASLIHAVVDGRGDGRPGVEPAFDLSADYDYDDRYRLVAATDRQATTTWSYDDVAKILSVTSGHDVSHLNVENRYGERGAGPDQLTSFGTERLDYDAAGRVTRDGTRGYTWDAKGRLVRVERGDVVEEYIYAHDDTRALKRTTESGDTTVTRYIDTDIEQRAGALVRYVTLDGTRLVRLDSYDLPADPGVTQRRGPATGAAVFGILLLGAWLLSQHRRPWIERLASLSLLAVLAAGGLTCGGGSSNYAHDGDRIDDWPAEAVLHLGDHQDSVVALADDQGALARETAYHPYGTVRATRGTDDDAYGYVGNERDRAVELGNFGARSYRFDAAAFLSVDPLALQPSADAPLSSAGLTSYSYADGSPVVLSDPDGDRPGVRRQSGRGRRGRYGAPNSYRNISRRADARRRVLRNGALTRQARAERRIRPLARALDTTFAKAGVITPVKPALANAVHTREGNRPPYDIRRPVAVINTPEEAGFVRVYGPGNKQVGKWLMRPQDIEGLSPKQIRNRFALPKTPTHVVDVVVPESTLLRVGTAATQKGWGQGGGLQFELLNNIPPSSFQNARALE